MPLVEPPWSSWGDLPVFYYTQRNPLPFAQYSTRAMFVSSMSCGKHLQEAVDEPFQHTAMPKCFLNPNYPIIFTFCQSQTKIHHLNVCNQNSFKSFQEAVDKPLQHTRISKGILHSIDRLFAPFAKYSTINLLPSSMSCGILQEAVDEPFQHAFLSKCMLILFYSIIFTFW